MGEKVPRERARRSLKPIGLWEGVSGALEEEWRLLIGFRSWHVPWPSLHRFTQISLSS